MSAVGVDYLYSAPYAGIYRGMGIVAANGVSTLPHNCLLIACLMALGAVLMNLTRVSSSCDTELRYQAAVLSSFRLIESRPNRSCKLLCKASAIAVAPAGLGWDDRCFVAAMSRALSKVLAAAACHPIHAALCCVCCSETTVLLLPMLIGDFFT